MSNPEVAPIENPSRPAFSFREFRQRWARGDRHFAGSELEDSDNDLRGCCLDGVDLSRSVVVASFRGASLRGARFVGANVKTCDFREADLRGADFREAALCSAEFKGANLEGALFGGAFVHSYQLAEGELPDW